MDQHFISDLLDAMADRAHDLDEAMREADECEFQLNKQLMEQFNDNQTIHERRT